MTKQKTYIAIDIKPFCASVECRERNRKTPAVWSRTESQGSQWSQKAESAESDFYRKVGLHWNVKKVCTVFTVCGTSRTWGSYPENGPADGWKGNTEWWCDCRIKWKTESNWIMKDNTIIPIDQISEIESEGLKNCDIMGDSGVFE